MAYQIDWGLLVPGLIGAAISMIKEKPTNKIEALGSFLAGSAVSYYGGGYAGETMSLSSSALSLTSFVFGLVGMNLCTTIIDRARSGELSTIPVIGWMFPKKHTSQ